MDQNSPSPRPRPVRPQPAPETEPALPASSSGWLDSVRSGLAASGGSVGRGASAAAVTAGVAIFAIVGLTGASGAESTAGKPAPVTTAPSTAEPTSSGPSTSPVAVVAPRPTEKAPADSATITSLAANGIPKVALNAYRVAAARVNHSNPGCHLDWSLLAGIGRAESDHGRFKGAKLNADGTSTPPVVGPALNGTTWPYFVADPAYVAVTRDATYAHALGPMQFIPSTWRSYGTDANGDGKADIFNVDDAALAAARYLCSAGADLATPAGRAKAVTAYNHNDVYVAQVLALADLYKRTTPVTGTPVGNTTGTLPDVGRTGALPPVNPANPTASDSNPKTRPKPKAPAKSKPGKGSSSGGSTGGSGAAGGSGSGGSGSGGSGGGTGNGGTVTDSPGDGNSDNPGSGGGGSDTPTDDPTTPPVEDPTTPVEDPTSEAPLCDQLDDLGLPVC